MTDCDVVVVGGGITGLAAAHRLAGGGGGPRDVVLLEASGRLGGKILTERFDGLVIEGGPDCFLATKVAGLELCRRLGLEKRLTATQPQHRRSYVKRNDRLYRLPDGLTGLVPARIAPLLRSRLLSIAGRTRAALEIALPPRRDGGDESIAQFARRRFGTEAYDWLIEPLLGGIFAGDGEALSLAATFPQLREAERLQGGLLRRIVRERPQGGGRPETGFVTLAGGLQELVDALARRLDGRVRLGTAVEAVQPDGSVWRVDLAGGGALTCRGVIIAIPAFAAAPVLAATDPLLAAELAVIPFVSTATVSVVLPSAAVSHPLQGSGYVSPRAEGSAIVACTWSSSKFPGRAPPGEILLRFFVGRSGRDQALAGDDGSLKAIVRRELSTALGIQHEPARWRIFRWPLAMPQYTIGHQERVARFERRLAAWPGLALAGASYRGVGIPDCIASGWAAADALAAGRAQPTT